MATRVRTATQSNLAAKLGEGASILADLHNGTVYGSIRTWVPVQSEDVRDYMIEKLSKVIAASAQAQQLIMAVEKEDLPEFLLVNDN